MLDAGRDVLAEDLGQGVAEVGGDGDLGVVGALVAHDDLFQLRCARGPTGHEERLHVQQRVTDRQDAWRGERAGVLVAQGTELARHRLVALDVLRGARGPGGQVGGREHVRLDLAVVVGVRVGHDEGPHLVLARLLVLAVGRGAHVGPQEHERLVLLAGQGHQQVLGLVLAGGRVRLLGTVGRALVAAAGRGPRGGAGGRVVRARRGGLAGLVGHGPLVVLVEEVGGVAHVVLGPHLGLHREQVLGVPEVLAQHLGRFGDLGEELGERLLVGPDDRVLGVDDVQGDGAVVGVDHGLHRVAGVVERPPPQAAAAVDAGGVGLLGVREVVRGGVGVEDVLELPVHEDHVGVVVVGEERGHRLGPGGDVALEEHLRVAGDVARQQRVGVTEAQGEGELAHEALGPRTDPHAVGALVGGGHVLVAAVLVVDLGPLAAHDHVARLVLAEVDAGPLVGDLGQVRGGLDRDVLGHQCGIAAPGLGVRRGRHDAVAVRVGEVGCVPRGVRHAGLRQVPRRDHHLGLLAVEVVAIDVDVVDLVEGLAALLLGEALLDLGGIPEAHVGEGPGVGLEVGRVERLPPVVLGGLDRREPVGLLGGLDVVAHVLAVEGDLVGVDPEALDEGGHEAPGEHGHEDPEADGHARQHPTPPPDVDDEEGEGEERDGHQQVERPHLDVDRGVGGPVHHAARREREPVAIEPVAARLHQGQHAEQHGDVGLHLRGDPVELRVEPDPAVDHVGQQGDEEGEQQGREQPAGHGVQERQLEHVEADVGVERGVLLAEVHAVAEQDPLVPRRAEAEPHDQGEERRHPRAHEPGPAADHRVVALDQVVLAGGGAEHRGQPLGDQQVRPAQAEEEDRADQRERGLGEQHATPHRAQVQRVEPEVVGVEGRDPAQRDQHDEQRDEGQPDDQPTPSRQPRPTLPAVAPVPTRRPSGQVRLGAHGRRSYRSPFSNLAAPEPTGVRARTDRSGRV